MKILALLLAVVAFNAVMSWHFYPGTDFYRAELSPLILIVPAIVLVWLARRIPPPLRDRYREVTTRHRWRLIVVGVLVAGAVAYGVIREIEHTLTAHYGSHSIQQALAAHMRANDGRWPKSWRELRPYLNDSFDHDLLERYWGVAWNIDPARLYRESPCLHQPGEVMVIHKLDSLNSLNTPGGAPGRLCFPQSLMGSVTTYLRERKWIE